MIPPPYDNTQLTEIWEAGVRAAEKRAVLLTFLGEHPQVLVHVCATRPGVNVPDQFRVDVLALRLGYQLNPRIADLSIDRHGWEGILTFRGVPFPCVVPWNAVYALQVEGGDKSASWILDAPPVIRARVLAQETKVEEPPKPEQPKGKPQLKLVP